MQQFRVGSKALHEALIADAQQPEKLTGIARKVSKLFRDNNFYTLKRVFNEARKDPEKLADFQAGLQSVVKSMNRKGEGEIALKGIRSLRLQFPDSETGLSYETEQEACRPLPLRLDRSMADIADWFDNGVVTKNINGMPQDRFRELVDLLIRNHKYDSAMVIYKELAQDIPARARYQDALTDVKGAKLCYWMCNKGGCRDMVRDFLDDRALHLERPLTEVLEAIAMEILGHSGGISTPEHKLTYISVFEHLDDLSGHTFSDDTLQFAVEMMPQDHWSYSYLKESVDRLKQNYPDFFCSEPNVDSAGPGCQPA